jgi:hypothetical protein
MKMEADMFSFFSAADGARGSSQNNERSSSDE